MCGLKKEFEKLGVELFYIFFIVTFIIIGLNYYMMNELNEYIIVIWTRHKIFIPYCPSLL